MIDLASFYTIQNTTGTQTGVPQEQGTLKEGGLGIFDILLNQIQEQLANGDNENEQSSNAFESDSKDGVHDKLIAILAGNDKIAEEIEGLDNIAGLDLLSKVEQTLALNQQVFDNKLRAGTGNDDLLIDKETGEIIVPDVAKTLNILGQTNGVSTGDINALIDNVDLSTLNLTPAQVTLVQDIQAGIVPTEAQAKEFQNILNTIVSANIALVAPAKTTPVSFNAGETPLPFGATGEGLEGGFEGALKAAAGKQYQGNIINIADIAQNADAAANVNNGVPSQGAFNILQAWPFAASGTLYGSAGFNDQIADQLGLSLNGQNNTAHGSLSALVNQAQSASQSHPATQMVAAALSKGANSGADTNIALRLDPPGLGRVEVNMTFSKDKTMKAVVTIEKPEAHMMLRA